MFPEAGRAAPAPARSPLPGVSEGRECECGPAPGLQKCPKFSGPCIRLARQGYLPGLPDSGTPVYARFPPPARAPGGTRLREVHLPIPATWLKGDLASLLLALHPPPPPPGGGVFCAWDGGPPGGFSATGGPSLLQAGWKGGPGSRVAFFSRVAGIWAA